MAPVLGLCALLAADAVLIGWAFRGAPVDDPSVAARPGTSSTPSVGPSVAGSSGAPSGLLAVSPVTRFVAPAGPEAAWVVDAGTCTAAGSIAVTVDGGGSWDREDLPGRGMRARPSGQESGFVTGGAGDDCTLRLWSTGDAGASWGDPASAADAWSRVPDDDRAVHRPNDRLVRPCADDVRVVDLSAVAADSAHVVCQDGSVRVTGDGGASWEESRSLSGKGTLAVGMVPGGSGVVVRTTAGCRGVVAVAVAEGAATKQAPCVASSPAPGRVSVAGLDGRWWLVVGDEVFRSTKPAGPWTKVAEPLPASGA